MFLCVLFLYSSLRWHAYLNIFDIYKIYFCAQHMLLIVLSCKVAIVIATIALDYENKVFTRHVTYIWFNYHIGQVRDLNNFQLFKHKPT